MKNKIIPILVIVLWLLVIFSFSNMNSEESNGKSKEIIQNIVTTTVNTTNTIHLTKIKLNEEKLNKITNDLNYPLRKLTHMTEYFILGLLLLLLTNKFNISLNKACIFTIIFCFIFAITDEVHQLYVSERTGQPFDVLIDTIGSLIGVLMYKVFNKTKRVQ